MYHSDNIRTANSPAMIKPPTAVNEIDELDDEEDDDNGTGGCVAVLTLCDAGLSSFIPVSGKFSISR